MIIKWVRLSLKIRSGVKLQLKFSLWQVFAILDYKIWSLKSCPVTQIWKFFSADKITLRQFIPLKSRCPKNLDEIQITDVKLPNSCKADLEDNVRFCWNDVIQDSI